MYSTGRLHYISVRANRELVKDVLTCQLLVTSTYKERHPDDTDDPGAVGVSSEDKAEGMGEVLGISRRLQKPVPSPAESSTVKLGSATPSDPATPAVPEEEGIIRVKRKDLRRAEGILKDILAGKRVRMSMGASCQDVPFEVPIIQPGERDCQLCCQSFKSTRSLKHHMKTHTGETGWSCSCCSKILASRAMQDLHLKSCGQEKGHIVLSNTASAGGHASDWSLAIYFYAFGWSLVYSLTTVIHRARDSWRSCFWKSQTDFSNRPDKRLVACYIFYIGEVGRLFN